ncbi:unnamed protein product [Cylicostephanus goldi]|uniref:Uncharacterized protein n=1 Tax=Cylicostephanus goldi TaxID=71465 RepID=A0A3P7Q2P5_CYLGO|nr:unnamed protein product [Cylicostephanus goldi]
MLTATADAKPIAQAEVTKDAKETKSAAIGDTKDSENRGESDGDEKDPNLTMGQYPCTADDHFELRLIDAVEKNPCIFNRQV